MSGVLDKCIICETPYDEGVTDRLLLCNTCRLVLNCGHSTLSYNSDYFLEEYRNHYGKTYLDDYENIYSLSKKRLKKIFSLLPGNSQKKTLRILDVGSAMGFFLKCAQDHGIGNVSGIEISSFAAEYSKDNYNIAVLNSSFEVISDIGNYDIVTAWFFIEHLYDPFAAISTIFNALPMGGIFALSMPSIFGPLFKYNREEWIKSHPNDHRIDISPKAAKLILKRAGFSKVMVYAAGFHPDRVLARSRIGFSVFSYLYRIYSKITSFSDTIEIYAVK